MKLWTQLGIAAAGLGTFATAVANAQTIVDTQPFVLKFQLAAQQSEQSLIKNLDRIDELEYRSQVLQNQLTFTQRTLADAPGDLSLQKQVDDTEKAIEKMTQEHDLLKCLIRKSATCTQ